MRKKGSPMKLIGNTWSYINKLMCREYLYQNIRRETFLGMHLLRFLMKISCKVLPPSITDALIPNSSHHHQNLLSCRPGSHYVIYTWPLLIQTPVYRISGLSRQLPNHNAIHNWNKARLMACQKTPIGGDRVVSKFQFNARIHHDLIKNSKFSWFCT